MQYPNTETLFAVDDQYLIGADLLVKPVTSPNVVESVVKFPSEDSWYDVETLLLVSDAGQANNAVERTVPSDINQIPVFQRGGSIIARKLRLRRSSQLMKKDPYTLFIALGSSKQANGNLYMDDEETFSHETKGEYASASISADLHGGSGIIRNAVNFGSGWKASGESMAGERMIERIVLMGIEINPSRISIDVEAIEFTYDPGSKLLVLSKPTVSALRNWEINIAF